MNYLITLSEEQKEYLLGKTIKELKDVDTSLTTIKELAGDSHNISVAQVIDDEYDRLVFISHLIGALRGRPIEA
jgi:hypothetical protein